MHSIIDAIRGVRYVLRSEQNFRLQIFFTAIVIVGIIAFPLKSWEIILLIILITMVLTMELLNTAFEHFADVVKPRLHEQVLLVKDIMAGAVLLTSLSAAVIGVIIFLPHFINLLK